MNSCLNRLPNFHKKITELRIIKLISMLWFILVELPLRLIKTLILARPAQLETSSIQGRYHYQTASLSDVMTEAYLSKDFSPLETAGKYTRLYYSPTLGLVVSLLVFGTVLRLNFLRKTQLGLKSSFPVRAPRKRLLDVRNIPVEYDEELNTWCTLNCSTAKGRKSAMGIPRLGLPQQTVQSGTIARSLIFQPTRN